MIVSAGNIETFEFATPIGVGLCESAFNLTRLALMQPPEFILFVGSAGSYGGYNIFDIVESKAASQIELSFIQKKSYSPLESNLVVSDQNVSHETPICSILSNENLNIINSSNYITIDEVLSGKLNRAGIKAENMEFFSVMTIAKELNIPCGGIFVITNFCNSNAHIDFKKNHSKAMKKLVSYLIERIPNLNEINT